jgi:alanine racemase
MGSALSRFAVAKGITLPVHLKVETGLNRYGLPPEQLLPLAGSLRELPGILVEALLTHFATGDETDKSYVRRQYEAFRFAADQLPWIKLRHVANTGTLLDMPELSLDMVRPGIGIYGCYPSPHVSRSVELRPILALKSRIARLRRLEAGECVSYGRTWTAARSSVVALLMCGYGDGLRRELSNKGSVLVRGRRAPIIGRIAMDMCVIDVTDVPYVEVDDEVVIIGRQRDESITVEEVASLCGTINYEILTASQRVFPPLREGRRDRLRQTPTAAVRRPGTSHPAQRLEDGRLNACLTG